MNRQSRWKDPGIILTIALSLYSAFVFIWWPAQIYVAGISLVGWLMFVGLFFWFLLGVIYVVWIEQREKKKDK